MMHSPLVSVICLCYNQSRFVKEAIDSVRSQTYRNIELIVVDDASTDNSAEVIQECVERDGEIVFLPLARNSGNCKAFNEGLRLAKGDYLIDLAADDILLPDRIAKGVRALEEAGGRYGVNFTDADWVDAEGRFLYRHSDRFPHQKVPQGDVYKELIQRFFICSPTMMFRRSVIVSLGGYDESLAYEDFDFWIRSSRTFHFCYTPEVLVRKRVVRHSMSHRQFTFFNRQLASTLQVCKKIMALNRSQEEKKALNKRIVYEMSVALRLGHIPLVFAYLRLYLQNTRKHYSS